MPKIASFKGSYLFQTIFLGIQPLDFRGVAVSKYDHFWGCFLAPLIFEPIAKRDKILWVFLVGGVKDVEDSTHTGT